MNKKIKRALDEGQLLDFEELFADYSPLKKEKILNRTRYLEAAMTLRKLRKKLELSQKQLAQKMNVEREFIARIESGRQNITLETFYRIAEAAKKRFIFHFK